MKNLYITLFAFLISFSAFGQAGVIAGTPVVCAGSTTTLSDTPVGGTWSTSSAAIGSVSSSGIVTGIVAGTAIITYTAPGGSTATQVVTVYATPVLITGPLAICSGLTTTLSDAAPGGAWTSSVMSVAPIGSTSGIATGVSPGTTMITYSLPTGCIATAILTVNPNPTSPLTITPNPLCVGSTAVLSDGTAFGVWSSSDPAVASVGGTGIITGNSAGTTIITYALGTGCFTTSVATVNATPAPISGPTSVCIGNTITLTDAAGGGTWSSSDPIIATIGPSTGLVTAPSLGTATISYTIPSGCSSSVVVTVYPLPSAFVGPTSICVGGYDTVTTTPTGGTWSTSGSTVVTMVSPGVFYGVGPGVATITYTTPVGCAATMLVTVVSTVAAITGPSNVCGASFITLTDATVGGIWSSSVTGVLTITSATGVATGVAPGTSTVTYSLASGCLSTLVVTVDAVPAAPVISGTSLYCPCVAFVPFTVVPSSGILWYPSATGGTGSSTAPVINTCIPGVTTNWASQTAGGCESPRASFTVTVDVAPTVTVTSAANCGGTFTLTGSGAGASGVYQWSPASGLSCTSCPAPVASISDTTTYSVIGTDASGCNGTSTATLNGDRVSGYISLTAAPTDTLKVWLIQFNVTDSSLIAEDSTFTCMDTGTPYYEFDSKPAGSYMVKAKLLSSVPGTSGYVPTYGLSSNTWDMATTLVHTAGATDTQHINMIYGTVPPGPGFIGGLISSGAGRGTSGGAPVVGMLVYLKDAATGTILTYTYTDATGAYSFSGIANGAYTIYPADYHYHTIPWVSVSPTTSLETVTGINFYQGTTSHTIKPIGTTVTPVCCGLTTTGFGMYPNPAGSETTLWWEGQKTGNAELSITDITGREVYRSAFIFDNSHGNTRINCTEMANGIYLITIKSNNINYTGKLAIQR